MEVNQVKETPTYRGVAIRRILVPTDLTPIADATVDFAIDLARRMEARVELFTVIGQVQGDVYSPIRYSPEASAAHRPVEALLRDELKDLAARHETDDVPVGISIQKGKPISSIIARASRMHADLLVVGTHVRGRIEQYLIRSATEEIVRRAPCSVLVIHERDRREAIEFKRILVPIDLSDSSEGQLQFAARVAAAYGAELHILHVIEPIPLLDAFAGVMTVGDMVPDMRRRSETEIRALLERLDFGQLMWKLTIEEGHAAGRILEEAGSSASDLIVIGKQGRSAIERFFVGSVAERVVRHAACPVLVAHVSVREQTCRA